MMFEEIRAAIEGHLAGWIGGPVAFDNVAAGSAVTGAQRDKRPWVRLTIQHGDSLTAYVGDGPRARRTGLIMCQVFVAERVGSRPAALLADSLAQHLEYWQDGPLETQAASVQRVGPQDGWFMYVVSCPFRAG